MKGDELFIHTTQHASGCIIRCSSGSRLLNWLKDKERCTVETKKHKEQRWFSTMFSAGMLILVLVLKDIFQVLVLFLVLVLGDRVLVLVLVPVGQVIVLILVLVV